MMLTTSASPSSSCTIAALVSSQRASPVRLSTLRVSIGSPVWPAARRRPGNSETATALPSSWVIVKRAASSPGRAARTSSTDSASSSRAAAWLAYTVWPPASCTVTASASVPRISAAMRSVTGPVELEPDIGRVVALHAPAIGHPLHQEEAVAAAAAARLGLAHLEAGPAVVDLDAQVPRGVRHAQEHWAARRAGVQHRVGDELGDQQQQRPRLLLVVAVVDAFLHGAARHRGSAVVARQLEFERPRHPAGSSNGSRRSAPLWRSVVSAWPCGRTIASAQSCASACSRALSSAHRPVESMNVSSR